MSMYIGVSGIKAATVDLNTTSHNIANASTTGFKNSRAEFGDLVDNNGAKSAGIGVNVQAVNQLFQQGGVITTGNALDLAIVGNGFFQVKDVTEGESTDPPFYTRAGSFHIDKDGFIVNNLGQRLQGIDGDLQFDDTELPLANITIDKDGNVNATGASGASLTADGGPLGLADFPNVRGLKKVSDTMWLETSESGEMNNGGDLVAPGTGNIGKVMSGALEASNVDLTDQLVNMIIAQRNFQANAQTITTNNTLIQTVINIR